MEYVRGSDYGGGEGGILYTLRGGTPSYTHYNSRGDVTAKSDGTGATTYQASYEAFGTRTAETGSTPDRQKANTKEEDPTGLLNEGFRYRDLETGVFLTRDPAGFVDGPNLYTYVNQNPWSKFDPLGLRTYSEIQSSIEKKIEQHDALKERQEELRKSSAARGDEGRLNDAERKENSELSLRRVGLMGDVAAERIQLSHLEASAKAISLATKEDVNSVLQSLDDESDQFKDGLTLARSGRAAELVASYYGGKAIGWGAGKLINGVIGRIVNRSATNRYVGGLQKLTGASDDILLKVGNSLDEMSAGNSEMVNIRLMELSKTPAGRKELQEMHEAVSALIPKTSDGQSASMMIGLQQTTGQLANGGK